MKPNPSLDELLSSFMDGELSPRQRTEVQRMAAHDPAVARRLRQLQNCRTLFCSLPPAEAPGDMLEQIRQSLERKTLLQEQPVSVRRSAGVIHLVFRKFVAAAAMISLLAVLGAVVYQVVAPVANSSSSHTVSMKPNPPESVPVDTGGQAPAMAVADAGFSGRLELQTTAFVAADVFVKRAMDTCGLVNLAEGEMAGDRRIYRVVGTREGINRLVASLSDVWENFDSASLQVDRPEYAVAPVTVDAVTPNQVGAIIARTDVEASIKTAEVYAVMNHMARNMPGGELPSLIPEDPASLWAMDAIPMPKLTGGPEAPTQATHTPAQGSSQASLTIVLLRSTK
jgi:anti-sigma factor RsiW